MYSFFHFTYQKVELSLEIHILSIKPRQTLRDLDYVWNGLLFCTSLIKILCSFETSFIGLTNLTLKSSHEQLGALWYNVLLLSTKLCQTASVFGTNKPLLSYFTCSNALLSSRQLLDYKWVTALIFIFQSFKEMVYSCWSGSTLFTLWTKILTK